MTIRPQHPLILRLLGLGMFVFGTGVLGFPVFGDVAGGAMWKVAAITTSFGLLFVTVGAYALLGRFEVEIDLPRRRVNERRQLGPLRWTRQYDIDDFDHVAISEREIRDSSHAMTFYQLHLRGRGRSSGRQDQGKVSVLLDNDKRYERIHPLAARVAKALRLDLYDRGQVLRIENTTRSLRQRLRESDMPGSKVSGENAEQMAEIAEGIAPLPRRLSRLREMFLAAVMTVPFITVVAMLDVKLFAMSSGVRSMIVATVLGIGLLVAPLLAICWGLFKTLTMREYLRVDARSLSLEQRWLLGRHVRWIDIDELMEIERSDEDLVAYGLHDVLSFGHGLSREHLGALHAELCRRIRGV